MRVLAAVAILPLVQSIPTITIGQDVHGKDVLMPLVGAGTWQYNNTVVYDALCKAFAVGYSYVATANMYENQDGVGRAIKDCWKGRREDLFVMTAVPGGLHTTEVQKAHRTNLKQLQLDYVDHVFTHYPSDLDVTPALSSPQMRQEEWKALEAIYKSGEARSIGVSHYCTHHLDDILAIATVRPSINQVEYHVGAQDVDHVMDKCTKEKIFFQSFSPLCGPCEYKPEDSLIHGKLVSSIAAKHNVSGSQVSLRFIVQQALEGNYIAGVIPKSDNSKHLASNLDLFGFNLTADEMTLLAAATQPAAYPGDCNITMLV